MKLKVIREMTMNLKISIMIVMGLGLGMTLSQGDKPMDTFVCRGAGRWYPADAKGLNAIIQQFYQQAETISPSTDHRKPIAAIAPHAGYVYSGLGNAMAYRELKHHTYQTVFVLGLSHYTGLHGAAILQAVEYQTPLGKIQIDQDIARQLTQHPLFRFDNSVYAQEHSLDNQIPFIQVALEGKFKLVPVMIGRVSLAEAEQMATELKKLAGESVFWAISSDFTHYGEAFGYSPFPVDRNVRANLEKLDQGAIDAILKMDSPGFENYLDRTGATICGANPIKVLLYLMKSLNANGERVYYYCSGDLEKDYQTSVSYASILFRSKP